MSIEIKEVAFVSHPVTSPDGQSIMFHQRKG
jgi:hypothetical protein